MARLNVYVFHCSRCGEPAISLFKEKTPEGNESQDTIFPAIDLKSIRAQCSACSTLNFAMRRTHLITRCWTGASR